MAESMLPRSNPEREGVDPQGILDFVEGMERKGLGPHSFMLVRHGHVIAEGWWAPYRRGDIHLLYSLSKSFTSTAVGFAEAEGLLSLQDKVIGFFPEDLPDHVSENLAQMRIWDLLTMTTGHEVEPARGSLSGKPTDNWARGFLDHPVPHKPGTHFLYNSAATYMCSAILRKVTGVSLLDYLRPRLFDPLGIQEATWVTCPRGIETGGWGLSVTTETLAKFGQLYLQKGVWEGRQVLPKGWVDEATKAQVSNADGQDAHDWNQGYGYQFWRSRHNFYRGDGAFGQNCVVMDELGMVLVTTASNPDLGATHQLVWDHILPAIQAGARPSTALTEKLASLDTWQTPTTVLPPLPSGRFADNQIELEIESRQDGVSLSYETAGERQSIEAPIGHWQDAVANIDGVSIGRVSARSGWSEGTGLTVRVCNLESPFHLTIRLNPDGEGYRYEWNRYGDFGPTEGPRGRLAPA